MTLHSFLVGLGSTAILVTACGLLMLHWRQDDLRHQHASGDHMWPAFQKGVMPHEPENRPSVGHKTLPGPERDLANERVIYSRRASSHPRSSRDSGAGERYRPSVNTATPLWQGANQRQGNWTPDHAITGRVVADTASAWDRRNAADLRAALDRADTNGPWLERHFAPIAYQARHALALPAGVTA